MNAKRKNFAGLPSGRSWTDVTLKKGMGASFAGVVLMLVQDVEATAHYEFDRGSPGSFDELPSLPTFEVVKLVLREQAIWVDDSSNYNLKSWKAVNILEMFDEETLQELDEKVKKIVQSEALDNFDIPEEY